MNCTNCEASRIQQCYKLYFADVLMYTVCAHLHILLLPPGVTCGPHTNLSLKGSSFNNSPFGNSSTNGQSTVEKRDFSVLIYPLKTTPLRKELKIDILPQMQTNKIHFHPSTVSSGASTYDLSLCIVGAVVARRRSKSSRKIHVCCFNM